jgi:hypothetical protein
MSSEPGAMSRSHRAERFGPVTTPCAERSSMDVAPMRAVQLS